MHRAVVKVVGRLGAELAEHRAVDVARVRPQWEAGVVEAALRPGLGLLRVHYAGEAWVDLVEDLVHSLQLAPFRIREEVDLTRRKSLFWIEISIILIVSFSGPQTREATEEMKQWAVG